VAALRQRIEAARRIQAERFVGWGKASLVVNGNLGTAEVQTFCQLEETGKNLMRAAMQQNLSIRW
jgi:magnesium chelatase family protein